MNITRAVVKAVAGKIWVAAFALLFSAAGSAQQPQTPVFAIGDATPCCADPLNFWGAQWWKNNALHGPVSNGVASFKGYVGMFAFEEEGEDLSELRTYCGGTWVSRVGNSPPPPATIPNPVAVIATHDVVKDGPNLSGQIAQIYIVQHDGGYGPNPGHPGNGRVIGVLCE